MSTFESAIKVISLAQDIERFPKHVRDLFDGVDHDLIEPIAMNMALGTLPQQRKPKVAEIEACLLLLAKQNIGADDPIRICFPLIDDITKKMEASWYSYLGTAKDEIWESFRAALCKDVAELCFQCATFEARSRKAGLLPTDSGGFFSRYPVLVRILASRLAGREQSAQLLVKRLKSDSPRLQSKWGCSSESIQAVSWNFSDPHWGASSVARLSFSGGAQLFYKPRSFSADSFLMGLAETIGLDLPDLVPEHIDCGGYGYALGAAPRQADNQCSVQHYYRRCGQLTVLSQLAGLTDLHSENLIAKGDRPVVIDSETIGDPLPLDPAYATSREGADFLIVRQTPLRSGLLPMPMIAGDTITDLSAFGGVGEQASPVETRRLLSDRPAQNERRTLSARANTLSLNGEVQHPADHYNSFLLGMQEASEMISNRQAAIAAYLNDYRMEPLQVRWVARPTAFYEKLIENLTHPSLAASILAADAFLVSRLATHGTWCRTTLLSSERQQIWEGDIPAFRLDGPDRWARDYSGAACVEFSHAAIDEVNLRLSESQQKEPRQQHIAGISLAADLSCMAKSNHTTLDWTKNTKLRFDLPEIIDQLNVTAIETDANIGWLSLRPLLIDRYTPVTTDLSLYDGTAGILFFTSACAALMNDKVARRLSSKLMEMQFQNVDSLVEYGAGGYDGISGICYGVEQAGRFLGKDTRAFRSACLETLREKLQNSGGQGAMDLVCGWAGCLLVTARMVELIGLSDYERAEWFRLGNAVAALISDCAQFDERRTTARWTPISALSKMPNGLAHGAGGIALALSEWARVSGNKHAQQLAWLAGRTEVLAFDARSNGWIDYRTGRISNYWCYGAAGLAYAFEVLARQNAREWRQALDLSKSAAAKFDKQRCGSLCHGAIGNMRILEEQGHELPWNEVELSLPGGAAIPGLMTGVSGVGMSLLERKVGRKLLPNVLTLSFRQRDMR